MGAALTLAIVAAILLGTSDLFGARATRSGVPAITVTRTAVGTSALMSPLLLLVADARWIGHDMLLGAVAGIGNLTGLILIYRGYAAARMGIVAPLASVLLATVPVAWDMINGVDTGTTAAVGMALGIVALVLTSYTPGGTGSVAVGAALGISSGVAFGAAFAMMGEISSDAGIAPVVAQRFAALVLLLVIGVARSEPMLAPRHGRTPAILAGALGLVAIGALQAAFQRGATGPVSVASSQFATVAVLLSVVFNRERMRWWQTIGVGTTAVAVALIAAGG
ncbi:MAG TPA: EamA family transporter [Ilumatobacteraceae bacterium]|nr:EamA family transporter [Ilumatobacteraceae bacterium]